MNPERSVNLDACHGCHGNEFNNNVFTTRLIIENRRFNQTLFNNGVTAINWVFSSLSWRRSSCVYVGVRTSPQSKWADNFAYCCYTVINQCLDSIAHSSVCEKSKHYKLDFYSLTALFVTHFSCCFFVHLSWLDFFKEFGQHETHFYICNFDREKIMN